LHKKMIKSILRRMQREEADENLVGDEEPATADETRAFLLDRSGRGFAPIAKVFVQAPPGTPSRHGPLSVFVRKGDLRALRALLLLYGIISRSDGPDGWSMTLPIAVWARAIDITTTTPGQAGANAASKALTRLEERKLIVRERVGRGGVRVTLLREDGSGADYARPGAGNSDRFLKLPHRYWTEGWFRKLDLPATAMLLVALHEKPGFQLPAERMPTWYGWSADTAERGFKKLIELGILSKQTRYVKAPLSPTGLAALNEYTLTGAFALDQTTTRTSETPEETEPSATSLAQAAQESSR
jgi:hypothetical protein